ncbi:unnamed protein product, partial [Polarella glacialis]
RRNQPRSRITAVAFGCYLALCGRVAEGATCKVESETCFTGSNLAISLGSSSQGCKEVADTAACCDLCASYWPQCLSWQYIQ